MATVVCGGVFWMDASQRQLYIRYSDALLQDNTKRTNRFNMPYCAFVVVDSLFKRRLVTCALLAGEDQD
ncbi:hypothetical protein BGX29_002483, partial [Mortierella sp. GBA35]